MSDRLRVLPWIGGEAKEWKALAGDPAATGLVRNIARPEANTTGFGVSEPSIAGKWLGFLKEAAPHISRVAVIFNPDIAQTASNYITSIEAAAPALSVQIITTPVHDAVDVVRAIDAFATAPNGGLVVLPPQSITAIFSAILRVATEHRLPAVYSGGRTVAAAGGLVAYGSNNADVARRAADYVDRLLRGAKVADLPIQFPTKYDLVINLRTARAIGLNIPATLRLRADEVIQ